MDNFSTSLAEALPPANTPRAAPEPTPAAPDATPAHVASNLSLNTPVPNASNSAPVSASAARTPTRDEEQPLVWNLKEIEFNGAIRKVVMQDTGGPCSFLAICNILILRGHLPIEPPGRTSVSYNYLSTHLAEHLLSSAPDVDIGAALSVMPLTIKGMDLNPVFTSPVAFQPASTGGELALFAQAGISLVHGWLADPSSPEYSALSRARDYDSATDVIVAADVLTRGRLVHDDTPSADAGPSGSGSAGPSGSGSAGASGSSSSSHTGGLSLEDRQKVEDAIALRAWLDATRSQLTYHGLFTLAGSLGEGMGLGGDGLFALFRNAHLAVLYKHSDGSLFTLATDESFLREPSVVWERLEDVDQASSSFVDHRFTPSAPVGGDWAGWRPDVAAGGETGDEALARQLQGEEDEAARVRYEQRNRERHQQQQQAQSPTGHPHGSGQAHAGDYAGGPGRGRSWEPAAGGERKEKKKKDCVIM